MTTRIYYLVGELGYSILIHGDLLTAVDYAKYHNLNVTDYRSI